MLVKMDCCLKKYIVGSIHIVPSIDLNHTPPRSMHTNVEPFITILQSRSSPTTRWAHIYVHISSLQAIVSTFSAVGCLHTLLGS